MYNYIKPQGGGSLHCKKTFAVVIFERQKIYELFG